MYMIGLLCGGKRKILRKRNKKISKFKPNISSIHIRNLFFIVLMHALHYTLTVRLLMSYIYIYIYMEHLFLMFLDHTQRRSTVGRTPLDE